MPTETYSNEFLARHSQEQIDNMQITLSALIGYGFTPNAGVGIVANIESESTGNPGIFEGLNWMNWVNGFGLVQWTPGTKYRDWAISPVSDGGLGLPNSYDDYGRIAPQTARINYEFENGIQYLPTGQYPLSSTEFKESTESPQYLTRAFMINYERPADQSEAAQAARAAQAEFWWENLDHTGVMPPIPGTHRRLKIWQMLRFP